ncbi:MAG: hypothetical protein LUH50_16950 [Bacteroides intestinalis]|nr:hypothetical protein [Bacteroides intestinalis]
MKKRILFVLFLSLVAIGLTGCNKDDEVFIGIDGIAVDNYPRIDGSTSTDPLNKLIACKLFGWRYEWLRTESGKRVIKESGYIVD